MGHAAAPLGLGGSGYQRHRPESTTLYAVVRDNIESLYAAVSAGFDEVALPPFVRRKFEGYLDCALLWRGFARLKCEGCAETQLVASPCNVKRLCLGGQLCQTALNLSEHVLPAVPLWQWVLIHPRIQ
ncbi:MAG: transposase zinc-binding domain-containing protein [Polyangiaceae bacterium]